MARQRRADPQFFTALPKDCKVWSRGDHDVTGRKCWRPEDRSNGPGGGGEQACGVKVAGAVPVQPGVGSDAATMKAKNVNLLFAFVAVLLFGFSCFCISRMNQTSKRGWWSGVGLIVGYEGDGGRSPSCLSGCPITRGGWAVTSPRRHHGTRDAC